jgi:mutator protein MutT
VNTGNRRPIVGVGAVIVNDRGEVLLVRRGTPPLHREWSIPGGKVERGETLRAALAREVREETGLDVEIGELIDVVDALIRDAHGAITDHYVLVDYFSWPAGGTLRAGSDAAEAQWVAANALTEFPMWSETRRVIAAALKSR